ncbi:MAG: transcriptional repressor [Firmicutes bacterium]|nr:transcriptional repressor [Bacillota bacterium]
MRNEPSIKLIQEQLKEHDYQLTPQREAVLKVLIENADMHLKVEDIYMRTKELAPEIGLATVYRTLELLEKINVVCRFEYGDGQSRYELVCKSEEHYHHHLICLKCGEISEFRDDLLDELEERISQEQQFKIVDHSLRFFGYCAKCTSR